MVTKLMERKIIPISLGFLSAVALFAVFIEGVNLTAPLSPLSAAGNVLAISYIAVPVGLLAFGIYRFVKTKSKQLLVYSISLLASAVLFIPLLYIGFLVVAVDLFGLMPTPS